MTKFGLKFTPTPRSNHVELKSDVKNFCRKLRLIEYWADKNDSTNQNDSDPSLVKNPSNFNPPPHRNIILDTYIDYLTKYPLDETRQNKKKISPNLKKDEWSAIIELKKDENLIIKEGDKGGSCVIMDKIYYRDKILTLLSDTKTYTCIDNHTIEKEILNKIKSLTRQFDADLTKKECDYLTNFDHKPSNIYGLPKVHKCKEIIDKIALEKNECVTVDCPLSLTMRPIIAGPQCVTSRLSDFIDKILRPYLGKVKSYIRDDIDFLTKIPRVAAKTRRFLTFDISSMYTNIDNDLGQEAIKYWLEKYPSSKARNIDDEFILQSLKIILEKNVFNFDGRKYLQIQGTAMGTKCAPVYATLVVAFLEVKLYQKFEARFGEEHRKKFENEWLRYLDDCFIYWDTTLCHEDQLHEILNDLHPSIKFTMESSPNKMNFLDVQLLILNDKVITDIYYKPTDTQNYVPFKSSHPKHTLKNIPYNLARRLCTIVDERSTLNKRLEQLTSTLIHLGYPLTLINQGIIKAKNIPQETLRSNTPKDTTDNLLTFVSTYNPRNPDMFSVIRESISILNASPKMDKAMKEIKLIPSRRQPENLKRILTRAKFATNYGTSNEPKVSQCKDPRCQTCKEILVGSQVEIGSKDNKAIFNIKTKMNCGVRDFLYVLTCNACKENYIGESGDTLRHRAAVHRNQIIQAQYRKLNVSNHVYNCAKNISPMFTICPFYKLQNQDETFRKEKEEYFIQKFKPSLNRAQNN